jgi:hypothetical protein
MTDIHPYIEWLTDKHFKKYHNALKICGNKQIHPLNTQVCLLPKSNPAIGDDRIEHLKHILSDKL